jgi:hypothetical protein
LRANCLDEKRVGCARFFTGRAIEIEINLRSTFQFDENTFKEKL